MKLNPFSWLRKRRAARAHVDRLMRQAPARSTADALAAEPFESAVCEAIAVANDNGRFRTGETVEYRDNRSDDWFVGEVKFQRLDNVLIEAIGLNGRPFVVYRHRSYVRQADLSQRLNEMFSAPAYESQRGR